ncbi:AEC family transporter [Pseudoxanthobacter sp.]|uniref:AEC family transporter n=1 Tax=Pseudoxanthobacter sp. TaxID=1925742 RepID=UPI002FE05FE5
MLSTLTVVLPIFALVAAGFFCRRRAILGPSASSELNRFVVYLALPALLFSVTAKASWQALWQPGFAGAFGLGALLVFALTMALRWRGTRHLADAGLDGLNAAYPNTGYMGFPLGLMAFGPASLAPVTIGAIITVCIVFAVAIVLIEVGLQAERRLGPLLLKVLRSLARNPLLIAPVLGALWSAGGLALPVAATRFIDLLGASASPCALVGLGLFLAERRTTGSADRPAALLLTALKLIVQPAVTWVLAYHVFGLPPLTADLAVMLAALPTGTGPFMLAEYYDREADVTARTILYSTLGSVVTLALFLWLSGHTGG